MVAPLTVMPPELEGVGVVVRAIAATTFPRRPPS
jgi:hypothetical protein